jgi:hypothetical protein
MFANTSLLILWASGIAVTSFALWKGGPAERIGASLNLLCAIATELAHMIWVPEDAVLPLLMIDFALAFGFLMLAVRFASIWLGAAMILQAVQFSLHAWYMITERAHDLFYFRVNNLDTVGITLMLVIGTVLSWRRRLRQRRAPQQVRAPIRPHVTPPPPIAPVGA